MRRMSGPQNQPGRFGEEKSFLAPTGIGTSDPPSLYTYHYAKAAPSRVLVRTLTFPAQRYIYVPPTVTITNMHAHTVCLLVSQDSHDQNDKSLKRHSLAVEKTEFVCDLRTELLHRTSINLCHKSYMPFS